MNLTPPPPSQNSHAVRWHCTAESERRVAEIIVHQHKAASRKTRLDIQNYGCNGNLLCYDDVVERNRISSVTVNKHL